MNIHNTRSTINPALVPTPEERYRLRLREARRNAAQRDMDNLVMSEFELLAIGPRSATHPEEAFTDMLVYHILATSTNPFIARLNDIDPVAARGLVFHDYREFIEGALAIWLPLYESKQS